MPVWTAEERVQIPYLWLNSRHEPMRPFRRSILNLRVAHDPSRTKSVRCSVNVALEILTDTSQTTFRRTVSSISSVRFPVQGKMHRGTPIAVSLLGLLVIAPAFAQESDTRGAIGAAASYSLPPNAVIDEIKFVGLHHIAPEAAKSPLSFHSGEEFNSARIA